MSYRDDGLDLDAIRRINNTVVNDDGTVKSFKEQLLEYEYGYYNSRVSVNEFLSVYERANIEFTIRKTWEKGLNLYPNEKTKSWIQSLGLQLPGEVSSLLDGSYRSVSKDRRVPVQNIIPNAQADGNTHDAGYSLRTVPDGARAASDALACRDEHMPGRDEPGRE